MSKRVLLKQLEIKRIKEWEKLADKVTKMILCTLVPLLGIVLAFRIY